MPLFQASPIRVFGRYLDAACGPVPRIVTAANLKALKPNDWLTVYHGTTLSMAPQLLNGFDATRVKQRQFGGPRHKGLFVTPTFRTARNFASYGPTVLEMVVRAKNLHGTDYSGVTGRDDPRREEFWRDQYPDSFRPYLSESLTSGHEPQALLQGLVAPRQIKRVWYAPNNNEPGQWYSRKEFLDLGLDPTANRYDKQDPLRDLGIDLSYPNYDYDEFIEALGVAFGKPGKPMRRQRIEETLAMHAKISMIPGRSDTLREMIEEAGFQGRAAQRYADRFRESLAQQSRDVAANASRKVATRRIKASVSGFMSDYKNWTAQGPRADWRQWWRNGKGKIVPLKNGSASVDDQHAFAANTVLWEGDYEEVQGDIHLEFIVVNQEQLGSGLGKQVIKILTDLADKHKVTMTLEPMMKGHGGLTTPQLDSWYRRLGWEEWDHEYGEGPHLIRWPKGAKPERVASQRFREAGMFKAPPKMVEEITEWVRARQILDLHRRLGQDRKRLQHALDQRGDPLYQNALDKLDAILAAHPAPSPAPPDKTIHVNKGTLAGWRYLDDVPQPLPDLPPIKVYLKLTERHNKYGAGELDGSWYDEKFVLKIETDSLYHSDWMDVRFDLPIDKWLTEAEELIEHEFIHAAQTILTRLKNLSDLAGSPSRKIRNPEYPSGGRFDESNEDTHALLDVEFYTRLNNEVLRFVKAYKAAEKAGNDPDLRIWLRAWVGESVPRSLSYKDKPNGPGETFRILRKSNKAKWKKAVGEFYKEVTKRLGTTPRRERVASRYLNAGLLEAPPKMVEEITEWVQGNTAAYLQAYQDWVPGLSEIAEPLARKVPKDHSRETKKTFKGDLTGWKYLRDFDRYRKRFVSEVEEALEKGSIPYGTSQVLARLAGLGRNERVKDLDEARKLIREIKSTDAVRLAEAIINPSVTVIVDKDNDKKGVGGRFYAMGSTLIVYVLARQPMWDGGNVKTKYKTMMADIAEVVDHELTHFAQAALNKLHDIMNAGLPSEHIRGKGDLDANQPHSRHTEHALLDAEFYTRLNDEVKLFIRMLARKDVTVEEWELLRRTWVADPSARRSGLPPRTFFVALHDHAPKKWRKAVGEFMKATNKASPTRVASRHLDAKQGDYPKADG